MNQIRFLALAASLFLLPFPLRAQQETLLGSSVTYGGFGGPTVAVSSVSGETALFVGGRGGAVFNLGGGQSFILGAGGAGLATDVEADGVLRDGGPAYLALGYGGLELEYVNRTNSVVHLAAKVLVGAGGITYRDRGFDRFDLGSQKDDAFFVVEPGVAFELNVTTFFRISTGLQYRWVNGIELEGVTDDDLTGPSGILTLKFGKF